MPPRRRRRTTSVAAHITAMSDGARTGCATMPNWPATFAHPALPQPRPPRHHSRVSTPTRRRLGASDDSHVAPQPSRSAPTSSRPRTSLMDQIWPSPARPTQNSHAPAEQTTSAGAADADMPEMGESGRRMWPTSPLPPSHTPQTLGIENGTSTSQQKSNLEGPAATAVLVGRRWLTQAMARREVWRATEVSGGALGSPPESRRPGATRGLFGLEMVTGNFNRIVYSYPHISLASIDTASYSAPSSTELVSTSPTLSPSLVVSLCHVLPPTVPCLS
jgi:hypothetical protein